MLRQFFLFTALSMSTVAVAQDKAALDFGAREGVADVSLSPDGTKIAYIGRVDRIETFTNRGLNQA
jgi:hypothetical protein